MKLNIACMQAQVSVGMFQVTTLQHLVGLSLFILTTSSSSLQKHQCQFDCTGVKPRPVCGTDGVTYRSRCELQEALCAGKVKFRHRGSCHSEADGSRCFEDKQSLLRMGDESGIPIFVPECNSDGTYKTIQCHTGTGYCWCVDADGKPVPGSSVRHNKPACHLLLATGRFRRGKKRKKSGGKGRKGTKKKRSRKICNQRDRSTFSSNLLEMVSTEQTSMHGSRGRPNGTILGNAKKEVAEWKFKQLDVDRDGILKRKELKKFREDIKKVLQPRTCSRSFTKYCDTDEDRKISKKEWRICVGIENISFNLFASLSEEGEDRQKNKERREKEQEEQKQLKSSLEGQHQRDQERDHAAPPSLYTRQFGERSEVESNKGELATTGRGRKENMDCNTARREATSEARKGKLGLQIPECTADGHYQAVQCYKSEGFCWCVDTNTGKPIVGTGKKNRRPHCGGTMPPPSLPVQREWRKCEGNKRTVFLARLFDWMTDMMANNSMPSHFFDDEPGLSLNQRVAKWQFIVLDQNRNVVLEKREVKRWKKVLRTVPGLTLCGKRINQHCDTNRDTKISQEEWVTCLGVAMDSKTDFPVHSPVRPVGERRGPNPLKTWLKGD